MEKMEPGGEKKSLFLFPDKELSNQHGGYVVVVIWTSSEVQGCHKNALIHDTAIVFDQTRTVEQDNRR